MVKSIGLWSKVLVAGQKYRTTGQKYRMKEPYGKPYIGTPVLASLSRRSCAAIAAEPKI